MVLVCICDSYDNTGNMLKLILLKLKTLNYHTTDSTVICLGNKRKRRSVKNEMAEAQCNCNSRGVVHLARVTIVRLSDEESKHSPNFATELSAKVHVTTAKLALWYHIKVNFHPSYII